MAKRLRKLLCWLGKHRRLDVIQTFGEARRIGCPDCKRQSAIHHGLRVSLPWDSDFESLYQKMGHDTKTPFRAWLAHCEARELPARSPISEDA